MLRLSFTSCAVVGSLALLLAAACEQKSETTPSRSTSVPNTPAVDEPSAGTPVPASSAAGGAASMAAEPGDRLPVSGIDTEMPMGDHGGHGGQGGHSGHGGKASR